MPSPRQNPYEAQPNRVTNAKYDYTLTQQRILLRIIKELQDTITNFDKGTPEYQLTLFKEAEHELYLRIPLKDVCKDKSYYNEVRDSLEQIANIPVQFAGVDPITGESAKRVGGLFTAYIPDDKYKREITIKIDKDVARRLIMIKQGYTNFAYEIAFNAKNKYSARIYQLISRWKDKGGFKMSIDEFRDWLVLDDKYTNFAQLKRRIIDPAYKELYKKADVWFEVASVEKEGKAVKYLNFKIITADIFGNLNKKKDQIINMLKMHFGFTSEHLGKVQPILTASHNLSGIEMKLLDLHEYVLDKRSVIENIPAYVVKSLLNEFGSK